MNKLDLKSSTDLWFCAFLKKKGHKLVTYDVISRGKGRFYFDLDDATWKDLKLEFNNSDLSEIKQNVESFKDLCF